MKLANIQNLVGFIKATGIICLDISTMVIDINGSYSENLDLTCQNIFLVMTAFYLSKNPPESLKKLLR